MNLPATTFHAAVIGAGVAGAVAATLLAAQRRRVLLVEKSAWPREKVCGGCLTAAASSMLREIGIDSPLKQATNIDRAIWHAGRHKMPIDTPGERAISRTELDAKIVAEAIARGAHFHPGTSASLLPSNDGDPFRSIRLQNSTSSTTIRAAVVLAADGITGTFLAAEPWAKWHIDPNAWIGAAAAVPATDFPLPPNEIHMHVGNSGYVGLVRINEAQMHVAAALDPIACKSAGGPGPTTQRILDSTHSNHFSNWESLRFRGTGSLTRRRTQLGGHRVLAIGDACGYVEPFTGEGIAWAIAAAREAVALLPRGDEPWPIDLPIRWRSRHHRLIAARQHWCRGLRPIMRHPQFAPVIMTVANAVPAITQWIATRISQPRGLTGASL
jgi:flavin-dependent dehydrogenase